MVNEEWVGMLGDQEGFRPWKEKRPRLQTNDSPSLCPHIYLKSVSKLSCNRYIGKGREEVRVMGEV